MGLNLVSSLSTEKAIAGFARVCTSAKELRSLAEDIHETVQSLLHLVDDNLDLSKLDWKDGDRVDSILSQPGDARHTCPSMILS